jgi:hypothetical protein
VTDVPIKDRPYHLFVSYAHEDHEFVSSLVGWLTKSAGLSVWHDVSRLAAGVLVAVELPEAIRLASGAVFVISRASAKSGWVREEYGAALEQRAAHPEYQILILRLDETEPPAFLRTTKWVDVSRAQLDVHLGLKLLRGLYADLPGSLRKDRDVYVSRSWRVAESEPADTICRAIAERGYRLIGDSTDQKVFDETDRVPQLIASCGAVVAVVPNRAGRTSPYIEEEIRIALSLGTPCLAVVPEGVTLTTAISDQIRPDSLFSAETMQSSAAVAAFADAMTETFRPPSRPHYAFYAGSLLKTPAQNDYIRELVDAVAGVDCILGHQLSGQHAQAEIIASIRGALFMIADVSEDGGINTLIEAGIALGAGTRLHLVARGAPKAPRFMFRDIEINFCNSDLEFLGSIHRISRPYRRRVVNRELGEWQ